MSELLKINVNEHVEKKNGLTYLSWAWAWAEVLKVDPAALWVCHTYGPPGSETPCMWIGKSAMVHVSVTIKATRRECMLPVMDHKNKAIPDPDAFEVNKAIMRCLAKCIAMHGLGLYIYAGEDLPEPVVGMSPEIMQQWLEVIRTCQPHEVAEKVESGKVAAEEVKDREAWLAIRDAGKIRVAALSKALA